MLFYAPTFMWMHDYQIVKRIARTGQPEECVYVYRLMMKDTVDELKEKRLEDRGAASKRFLKSVMKKIPRPSN